MKRIISAIDDTSHILEAWLPTRVELSDTPGISVAISYKGKILYKNGFGYSDREKGNRANTDTIYHIASISKTFTSVAILQLMEEGKLKLDDPVSIYVKWFKGRNKNGDIKNITIKQLLSNTSGIWRDGDTPHWVTGKFPKKLNISVRNALIFKPSSEFKYSNYGFAILGEVIKMVSGISYEEYVQKNILDVLKLKSTYPDYKNGLRLVASGYGRKIPGKEQEKFAHYKANAYMSATGFLSNALDLAKYAYHLSPQSNSLLLKNNSKKKMMMSVTKTDGNERYCLGLEVYKINKRKVFGHAGGFQGFASNITFDPKNEIAVAVLTNEIHAPAGALGHWILQIIYNLLDSKKDYLSQNKVDYKKYEGIYRNLWGDSVIVRAGRTLVSFNLYAHSPLQGDSKRFLVPTGKNQFTAKGGSGFHSKGERIKFTKLKNNKFQAVSFGPTVAKRVA